MKKALIVLLILGLAGGLFAQSWSGHVRTGAKFTFDDGVAIAANDDDGNHPVYVSLAFKSAGDDWGVNFSANAGVDGAAADYGNFKGDMNGWVNFGGIFTLTAGKGVGGNWRLSDALGSFNIPGSAAGVRLNIKPISGLDFGFVFGYPNTGVNAGAIANFFQESGVGAKYDAGIFNVGTSLKLFSEETTGYPELDANWCIDVTAPVPALFNVLVSAKAVNLFGKKAGTVFTTGIKLDGDVAGLGWEVSSQQTYDPEIGVTLSPSLSYGIPINDKANLDLDAGADFTVMSPFSFDGWSATAKATYNLTSKVSTYGKFNLAGDADGKLTPTLNWAIKYNF
jgi:hypothetical protein